DLHPAARTSQPDRRRGPTARASECDLDPVNLCQPAVVIYDSELRLAMPQLRRVISRLLNSLRPGRTEADLQRELETHLALLAEELERGGLSPAEARLAARHRLGDLHEAQQTLRASTSLAWLDDARRDMRYAARLLWRSPLFTLTAALSLAIG